MIPMWRFQQRDNEATLLVRARRWFEARTAAIRHFACGIEDLKWEEAESVARSDKTVLEVTWTGSAAGTPNTLQMHINPVKKGKEL